MLTADQSAVLMADLTDTSRAYQMVVEMVVEMADPMVDWTVD